MEEQAYRKYMEFLQNQCGVKAAVRLHNIFDYLKEQAEDQLGATVIAKLAQFDSDLDSDAYMKTLSQCREKIDKWTAAFLFHQWIRIITLRLYPPAARVRLAEIPIAYLPANPFPEAFITKTPYGPIICFSDMHVHTTLDVFQSIVKAVQSFMTEFSKPQFTYAEAAQRVWYIAQWVVNAGDTSYPDRMGLEEMHIDASDRINNCLQVFILAHEYGHFLCGHLSKDSLGKRNISTTEGRNVDFYDHKLQHEFEADTDALNYTKALFDEDESVGPLLLTSIIIYFGFLSLCRKLAGFPNEANRDDLKRINRILKQAIEKHGVTRLGKEIQIIDMAQRL